MTRLPLVPLVLAIVACNDDTRSQDSEPSTTTEPGSEITTSPASLVGSPRVDVYGSLQEIFMSGDLSAQVSLADLPLTTHTLGLGALSDLRGEVAITAGDTWLSYPDGPDATTANQTTDPTEEAALLVVSEVPAWTRFTLAEDTTSDALADTVATMLDDAHWPGGSAIPMKIEGGVASVDWHVIDGSLLPEGSASHEDHEAASVKDTLVAGNPVIVGFYSTMHAGVITHGGEFLHLHVVDEERAVAGHVDAIELLAGATIYFPSPDTTP